MIELKTFTFFRLNWPFGKKSNPVKRHYTRRKKIKKIKLPKKEFKKEETK